MSRSTQSTPNQEHSHYSRAAKVGEEPTGSKSLIVRSRQRPPAHGLFNLPESILMSTNSIKSNATPTVTVLRVVPVAGRDSMLMNLSGAHGRFFTRNIVIFKDS